MSRPKLLPDDVMEKMYQLYQSTPKRMGRTREIMSKCGVIGIPEKKVMHAINKYSKRRNQPENKQPKQLKSPKNKEAKQLESPKKMQRPPSLYSNKSYTHGYPY